jgi:signal transduction histidine kinase
VRTRLATDLHDDLGAGLAEIAILTEVARREASESAGNALAYVATRARGLRGALGDIVWTVDPSRDHLDDLVRRMRETALTMLENGNRNIHFSAPHENEMEHIELPPDVRRHLLLFFKESVTNIARHAEATDVSLELSLTGRRVRMLLRDNGRGFDPEKPAPGRGLSSLRYRAGEMKGDLRLKSTVGQGTEIELSVTV